MKSLPVSVLRARPTAVFRAADEPTTVDRHGEPIGVILSIDLYRRIHRQDLALRRRLRELEEGPNP
ncbi:hypothetical protein CGZ95_07620 [Enemella evansiae]|nr:hypothetical protein CGZ95_07620 [Enemella evansiae]